MANPSKKLDILVISLLVVGIGAVVFFRGDNPKTPPNLYNENFGEFLEQLERARAKDERSYAEFIDSIHGTKVKWRVLVKRVNFLDKTYLLGNTDTDEFGPSTIFAAFEVDNFNYDLKKTDSVEIYGRFITADENGILISGNYIHKVK